MKFYTNGKRTDIFTRSYRLSQFKLTDTFENLIPAINFINRLDKKFIPDRREGGRRNASPHEADKEKEKPPKNKMCPESPPS